MSGWQYFYRLMCPVSYQIRYVFLMFLLCYCGSKLVGLLQQWYLLQPAVRFTPLTILHALNDCVVSWHMFRINRFVVLSAFYVRRKDSVDPIFFRLKLILGLTFVDLWDISPYKKKHYIIELIFLQTQSMIQFHIRISFHQ